VSNTAINYVIGDATNPIGDGPKVIIHVCNDIGGWGRGFVLALSKRWATPEAAYRAWYKDDKASFNLGATQIVPVGKDLLVMNMIAQEGVNTVKGVPPIRYKALEHCLNGVAGMAKTSKCSVHMPRIGCGLAGGDWEVVEGLINYSLIKNKIEVYVYDLATKDK